MFGATKIYELFTGRSGKWPKVRATHLISNPECAACGKNTDLAVHHKLPFAHFPELELEPGNLITLCESKSLNCHLVFGHCLRWDAYNPFVVEDAFNFLKRVRSRICPTE